MMNGKKIGIGLGILCLLLLLGNGILYMNRIQGEPAITFTQDAPVYVDDMGDEELLSNVRASDRQDGDLTDQVIVDQVVKGEKQVKVKYLVTDSDHHVVVANQKLSRESQDQMDKEAEETVAVTPTATPEPTPTPEPVNPELPVITLNTDAATLKVGDSFQFGDYIEDFSDNKDDQTTLGGQIHVEGADTTTPGVKEVHYYIIDSDNNRSIDAILTLTVE